jgi:hypothetical protein
MLLEYILAEKESLTNIIVDHTQVSSVPLRMSGSLHVQCSEPPTGHCMGPWKNIWEHGA